MKPRTILAFGVVVSLLAIAPKANHGQSQSPQAAQQPSAASTVASASPQGEATPQAKPAKVWTNDEIDVLRNDHSVSTVGTGVSPKSASVAARPKTPGKDPAWYRRQLRPLQADIDKLDGQIAKMKAFLSGEYVGDPPTIRHQMVPSPQEQLKQMEAKRQADAAKIDDLLDQARHDGIEPGALR